MGANMMRQWLVPEQPEPALVRTGNEPDVPGFWCGRNLLTAFIPWGGDVFEDALLLSESGARKLGFPHPLEPGDKLSNRHGTKGVVSRIVPDDEMPHMPDGAPVELVFSFMGCHTRLNLGQIREAVLGRIARAEGRPVICPPFAGPKEDEIRRQLKAAGLPQSGMETLSVGKGGQRLPRPSTVGWVYWGKTFHLASGKLTCTADAARKGQSVSELEYFNLRDAGAFEVVRELFSLRQETHAAAAALAERVAAGPVEQAGPPTPAFAELQRRLAAAGIRADFDGEKVRFSFAPPAEPLRLARPVPHPWLEGRELTELGRLDHVPEFAAVSEANERLARIEAGKAPSSLAAKAAGQLAAAVERLLAALVQPDHVRLGGRTVLSGRSVIAPGVALHHDQVGLPEEMAWTLFGPLAAREVGPEAVEARGEEASAALDEAMRGAWVLVSRAPTILPTSILALRPVRVPGRAVRLHPMACMPMNADFDGDQVGVFALATGASQREAGEVLSPGAQCDRDRAVLGWMVPKMGAMWGLAELSRSPQGLAEVRDLAGADVAAPDGFVTHVALVEAVRARARRDGSGAALEAIERLVERGFEVGKLSGASLSPFPGEGMDLPPVPRDGNDHAAWETYQADLDERLGSRTDYDAANLGPQLLAVKSGARGNLWQLRTLLAPVRIVDVRDRLFATRHALHEGLTCEEYVTRCVGARKGLANVAIETTRRAYGVRRAATTSAFTVLARAMRSARPGIVFARAAAIEETDPLLDIDSRLFVGPAP
jgi:hypothetical protein